MHVKPFSHSAAFLNGVEAAFNEGEQFLAELDPAWAKSALFFRTGYRAGHPKGSMRTQGLVRVRDTLDVYRARLNQGDTLSLLHAISICAQENVPMPTWLATTYQEAFNRFLQPGGPTTLDEVFFSPNLPTKTAKKGAEARQDWQLGAQLYGAAWDKALKDLSIDSFHAVMTKVLEVGNFGVGITKAKELFLMVEKNQLELLGKPASESLSRFLEVRRKT